jgi:hypothetical protein
MRCRTKRQSKRTTGCRAIWVYNVRRSHMALGGLSPQQRLNQLLCAEEAGEKTYLGLTPL